jgi:AbrB family looped-hinge helix DNA binding protein
MPSSILSSKGQITVPVEVRHRLGLKPGDRVEFVFENGRTEIHPVRPAGNPFARYIGVFPAFSSTEEVNAFYRDLREDDPWSGQPDEASRR